MRSGAERRRTAFVTIVALAVLCAGLALVPTPYYVLAPGTAVDLSRRVTVEGRAPARRSYFLTDVSVRRASVLLLAAAALPGVRVVRHDTILPPGQTFRSYDAVLDEAMNDSQRAAAYVAERAAGFRVAQPQRVVEIVAFAPWSRAIAALRVGDQVVRIDGRNVVRARDVANAVARAAPGTIAIDVLRAGRRVHGRVAAIARDGSRKIGIALGERSIVPELPVPVHFAMDDVEGSSGGLMFALTIYAELAGDRGAYVPVAGTGTIAVDGSVGPIEGTQQKIVAAERAGARLFLVPPENYADVRGTRGIAVVPVRSFAQALAAVAALRS